MKVDIYSRKDIYKLIDEGFPKNTVVISFYTLIGKRAYTDVRVNYDGVCDRVFYVGVPDIDIFIKFFHNGTTFH